MKKKKENNKKVLITIIIILILIIISIVTIIVIKSKNKNNTTAIMGIYDKTQEEVPSLKYSNISEISTITEDSTEEIEIAKKFRTIFENNIPKLKVSIESFNEEEINAYYEENQKEIKQDFYYIEKEDFKLLCKQLQEMTSNLEQDFDICDFKANCGNKIDVTCSYKNGEKIAFTLSSSKKIEYKK